MADVSGKVFRLATVGFFRQATIMEPKEAQTHLRYALALSFSKRPSFELAESHFLKAITLAPQNRLIQDCLDFVLAHFAMSKYTAGEAVQRYQVLLYSQLSQNVLVLYSSDKYYIYRWI